MAELLRRVGLDPRDGRDDLVIGSPHEDVVGFSDAGAVNVIYGHGGSAPGMNAILRVYPESGQSVIVLCNLDSPSASRMGDWLHARMPLK